MGELLEAGIKSPLGPMHAISFGNSLCLLEFDNRKYLDREKAWLEKYFGQKVREGKSIVHEKVQDQIDRYFSGSLKEFDIELLIPGTDFQREVWNALLALPWGSTTSYSQLAKSIGKPKAVRALANAVGQNRLVIIVPCHRVIGANGSLTGFAAGIEKKRYLLGLESGSLQIK